MNLSSESVGATTPEQLPAPVGYRRTWTVLIAVCLLAAAAMTTTALLSTSNLELYGAQVLAAVPEGVSRHYLLGTWVWIDRSGTDLVIFRDNAQHLGEGVVWCADQNLFISPAHGEIFDRSGQLLSGPATRGLDRYQPIIATVNGQRVVTIDPESVILGAAARPDEDRTSVRSATVPVVEAIDFRRCTH